MFSLISREQRYHTRKLNPIKKDLRHQFTKLELNISIRVLAYHTTFYKTHENIRSMNAMTNYTILRYHKHLKNSHKCDAWIRATTVIRWGHPKSKLLNVTREQHFSQLCFPLYSYHQFHDHVFFNNYSLQLTLSTKKIVSTMAPIMFQGWYKVSLMVNIIMWPVSRLSSTKRQQMMYTQQEK